MIGSILTICLNVSGLGIAAPQVAEQSIPINRTWDLLPANDLKKALLRASKLFGRRRILLAGVTIDGKVLSGIHKRIVGDDLNRPFREHLRLPIDPEDFLLFLDDLLSARLSPLGRQAISLPPSRLRKAGILLHPDDVFRKAERRYAGKEKTIVLTDSKAPTKLPPARNGSYIGPRWAYRYKQPETQKDRLWALYRTNPDFSQRVRSLVKQLRKQGVKVVVESTVRDPRRGFLLYASYVLGRSKTESEVKLKTARLQKLNREWGLKIPINFVHSGGWQVTAAEARKLAETFGVTYATENGARKSDHYGGRAVDIYAVGLPRMIRLKAPNGKQKRFDLYADSNSRDLNLTPEMITWIEDNFLFKKLKKDYPHWRDNRPRLSLD